MAHHIPFVCVFSDHQRNLELCVRRHRWFEIQTPRHQLCPGVIVGTNQADVESHPWGPYQGYLFGLLFQRLQADWYWYRDLATARAFTYLCHAGPEEIAPSIVYLFSVDATPDEGQPWVFHICVRVRDTASDLCQAILHLPNGVINGSEFRLLTSGEWGWVWYEFLRNGHRDGQGETMIVLINDEGNGAGPGMITSGMARTRPS